MMTTTQDSNTLGYLGLSGILHTGLAIFVMVFAVDAIHQPEIIQLEILSAPKSFQPIQATPEAAPAEASTPKLETPIAKTPAPIQEPKVSVNRLAKSGPTAAPKIAASAVPATSPLLNLNADDISVPAPKLTADPATEELSATPALAAAADLEDSAIAEDLDRVDQEAHRQTSAQLAALRADVDSESDVALKEHQQKISALERSNQQEAKHLAALAAAQAEAARGAAERAAQKAAAERAAQAQADADTRAAQAQQAQVLAAQNTKASGGGAASPGSAGGSGEAVRTLEELRQRPGNKKPVYDQEDRFQGRQGEIRFMAYVTKEGTLSQIKPIKLTGHRSLDLKTLKAIKEWKFYPGQEGWVEIPYIWNLKGEPQEMQGGLRTKVGQN